MAELNETPRANRIHIAFFGLRNAGKSTLVNAFTGQDIAIVSDVAGTTTDPVSKAMEILPLGPCLITDTAGLDDIGELGAMRVEKTLKVLETTDVAVWVHGRGRTPAPPDEAANPECSPYQVVVSACREKKIALLEFYRGDPVDELKNMIASLKLVDDTPGLLDGLVTAGDRVICVCPIDESAPKGRLILPQVQVIRECLDRHVTCTVCQPEELDEALAWHGEDVRRETRDANGETGDVRRKTLVVTDSQAFKSASEIVGRYCQSLCPLPNVRCPRLTSFSILFARQKGDLKAFLAGLEAVAHLKDGDRVLVAEGCTHHRQCNDIGTTKIPKALAKLTGGKQFDLIFASGTDFPVTPPLSHPATPPLSLVVQCGGCVLTRREMLRRIDLCRAAGVPIVNYGILLAGAAGLDISILAY